MVPNTRNLDDNTAKFRKESTAHEFYRKNKTGNFTNFDIQSSSRQSNRVM